MTRPRDTGSLTSAAIGRGPGFHVRSGTRPAIYPTLPGAGGAMAPARARLATSPTLEDLLGITTGPHYLSLLDHPTPSNHQPPNLANLPSNRQPSHNLISGHLSPLLPDYVFPPLITLVPVRQARPKSGLKEGSGGPGPPLAVQSRPLWPASGPRQLGPILPMGLKRRGCRWEVEWA